MRDWGHERSKCLGLDYKDSKMQIKTQTPSRKTRHPSTKLETLRPPARSKWDVSYLRPATQRRCDLAALETSPVFLCLPVVMVAVRRGPSSSISDLGSSVESRSRGSAIEMLTLTRVRGY